MSKTIHVDLELVIPDEADPDTVAGWVFNLLCEQDTEQYESCDGYDYRTD